MAPPRAGRAAAAAGSEGTPRRGAEDRRGTEDADDEQGASDSAGGPTDDVLATVRDGFQQLLSRMDLADARLARLEGATAAPAAGADRGATGDAPDAAAADGDGEADDTLRCCLPGCEAARFIEIKPDGTRCVHPFCRLSHAAEYDRQMGLERGDGGGDGSRNDGNSRGGDGTPPGSIASEAGMDIDRDDDDARSSTRSDFRRRGPHGTAYNPRHVFVGADGILVAWASPQLQRLVQQKNSPMDTFYTDLIVANELLSEVQHAAQYTDDDTARRYAEFLALLRRATTSLNQCIDVHVVHPLTTGSSSQSLVLRRAIDPIAGEAQLYTLPSTRELIRERMLKDADKSAGMVTGLGKTRDDRSPPRNRRGNRGGGGKGGGKGTGDPPRKTGGDKGGGNKGGGDKGGGDKANKANGARGASQERKTGTRGGADGAPRAD